MKVSLSIVLVLGLNIASVLADKASTDVIQKAKIVFQEASGLNWDDPVLQDNNFQIPDDEMFETFKQQYGKKYSDKPHEMARLEIFRINSVIAQIYQKLEQGTAIYGITKFSDLSVDEFRMKYTGLRQPKKQIKAKMARIPTIQFPNSVDWRKKGAVTPIKNQENCGSCWAFSTTGNIEGQWFIKHGQLTSLSEQQLVDCDKIDYRCNGGYPFQAMESIKLAGGIESEKVYPYMGMDYICHFNQSLVSATVTGYVNISSNEDDMAAWCAANGPISIGLNSANMQSYQGGIAHPTKSSCDPRYINHAVLIVGYAMEGSTPYWIVKNSWGTDWGETGYWRVFRGDNVCGLSQQACSATV